MASIIPLADGRFRVFVSRLNVRDSKILGTKTEAKEWGIKREAEILAGDRGEIPDKLFGEVLDRYSREVSPTKKGSRWEMLRLDRIRRTDPIAQVHLRALSTTHVAEWRDRRIKAVSAGSVLREWNLLCSVCSTCIAEWRWLKDNPFSGEAGVKRPRTPLPRFRVAQDHEIQALRDICTTDHQKLAVLAFEFGTETAMRAGEICRLARRDVKGSVARVVLTKNGHPREVPLSPRAVEILTLLPDMGPDVPVFGHDSASLDVTWRKLTRKTGIENLHFHDSRHTAATRLAKKLHVMDLARMMGIRDLKILMVYYNETAESIAQKLI